MTATAEIAALEDRRCAAMTSNDLASLAALLADDLVYTHSSAAVDTKASYLQALSSGRTRYREVTRHRQDIAVHGDTAVVSGHVGIEVTVGGVDRSIDARFLAVWAKVGGTWQFVAWQSTPIPPA
jgi:ketosteroid isomerase-like protein